MHSCACCGYLSGFLVRVQSVGLLGRGLWGLGESGVWLLWEVEEFFLFGFAGSGFLGGFVSVAFVA